MREIGIAVLLGALSDENLFTTEAQSHGEEQIKKRLSLCLRASVVQRIYCLVLSAIVTTQPSGSSNANSRMP